jgi:hypothetical protein
MKNTRREKQQAEQKRMKEPDFLTFVYDATHLSVEEESERKY